MSEIVGTETGSRRRRRMVVLAVAAVILVAAAAFLTVPRTVASGGEGADAWRVRVAPLGPALAPRILVEPGGGAPEVAWHAPRPHRLEVTRVVPVGSRSSAETVVVGPTPRHADSVRVSSEAHGVGEARPVRVGWSRFHVARLSEGAEVAELVAISDRGSVIEVHRVDVAESAGG